MSTCCARLRPSNQDGAAGCVEELTRIAGQIRTHWPKTRIIIRGDSSFCREGIMSWCEDHDVGHVLRLARNARLSRALGQAMEEARVEHAHTGIVNRRDNKCEITIMCYRLK